VSPTPDVVSAANLTHALRYAEHGWHLFPCRPRGKEPITPNGCTNATRDPLQLTAYWDACPNANIGVNVGKSGLIVVDADTPEACGWLERQPVTRTASTARGFHAYYRAPEGVELASTSGTIHRGIDTRAGNAYVLAPPSIHSTGVRYAWLNARELAPLPAVFLREPITRAPEGGWRDIDLERVRVQDERLARLLADPGPRGDVSAGDYAIACTAIRMGLTDGQIGALILAHRERCNGKKKDRGYLHRTISAARGAVR
jgi:hypothetical protein